MRKKIAIFMFLFILAGVLTCLPKHANAQFGIGVILGQPTGLSIKVKMGGFSVDGALAYSFHDKDRGHLHLHISALWDIPVIPVDGLMLYAGVGGRLRIWDKDKYEDLDKYEDGFRLAVRIPLGIEYMFKPVPIGIFLEFSFNISVFPYTGFDFGAAIGARWYF